MGSVRWKGVLLAGVLASGMAPAVGSLSGCQEQEDVFSNSGRDTDQKERFWDGQSAVETTQSRKQSLNLPFGLPTGASDQ